MDPADRAGLPPGREFLLSHHVPEHYDRTLGVAWRGRTLHLCSRCTGQGVGALTLLAAWASGLVATTVFLSPTFQVLWALAPLPATVDWTRQSVRGGESTNARRLVTGALLGATFLDVILLLAARAWLDVLVAAALFLAYAAGIAAVLFRTGAWRRVLQDHLPGIELPPA